MWGELPACLRKLWDRVARHGQVLPGLRYASCHGRPCPFAGPRRVFQPRGIEQNDRYRNPNAPLSGLSVQRRLAAITFTDIVAYTALMAGARRRGCEIPRASKGV